MSQRELKFGKDFAFPWYRPKYPREKEFNLIHAKYEVDVDLKAKVVYGKASITFEPISEIRQVKLDAIDFEINSVESNEMVEYSYDGEVITINFNRELKPSEKKTITIIYTARPLKGLYFISPDKHYPDRPYQAWSQGESEDNRYWIPIYDYPNAKLTSELIAKVDKGLKAISNGKLLSVREENGKTIYHWLMDIPHSPYLISLVVGDFEEVIEYWEGIPIIYYFPRWAKEIYKNTFSKTPKMLEFFSKITGLKYPYQKYAQVIVSEFVYGGMENTTATTLTERTLHDEIAHMDFSSDPLISHELAHQWFGDLITTKDWANIWLNEAFATYMEAMFTEYDKGKEEFLYELYQNLRAYLEEYSQRYSRPIVNRMYEMPEEMFDRHTYEKGSLVLHTLRNVLGDETFIKGISHYVNKYKFQIVDTEDLRKALEEIYGKSLDWFFDQFVYSAGHPVLKVSHSYDEKSKVLRLEIKQAQEEVIYTIDLDVLVITNIGKKEYKIKLKEKENVFYLPVEEKPLTVQVDPWFKLIRVIDHEKNLEELLEDLKSDSVIAKIEACNSIARKRSRRAVQHLERILKGNEFWGVKYEAAIALGRMGIEEAEEALIRHINVEPTKARRGVAKALGEFKSERALEALRKMVNENVSYYVRSEALASIGKAKDERYFDFLVSYLEKDIKEIKSHNYVIASGALNGISEYGDERAMKIVINMTQLGVPQQVRETGTKLLGKFSNNETFRKLVDLLKDDNFRVRINAINALKELGSPKAIPMLDELSKNDLDNRVRRYAMEVIKHLKEGVEKSAEFKALKEEVERLREENKKLTDRIEKLEHMMKESERGKK
jgi:aminopeptidase N